MPHPVPVVLRLLAVFALAFTRSTFAHALTLSYGAILAPGRRTVTAALRAVGLDDERHFTTDHRVLNRAWSPLALSKAPLGLILTAFVGADAPLVLVDDDTLERRFGRRVAYKARYHESRALLLRPCRDDQRRALAVYLRPGARPPEQASLGVALPHRALPHARRQCPARQTASHRPGAGGDADPPHPPLATRSVARARW